MHDHQTTSMRLNPYPQRYVLPPAGMALPKRAYRVRDLVYMLGLPKSTIHDLIRRGQLRAVPIGNGRRRILLIPAESVEQLLSGSKDSDPTDED